MRFAGLVSAKDEVLKMEEAHSSKPFVPIKIHGVISQQTIIYSIMCSSSNSSVVYISVTALHFKTTLKLSFAAYCKGLDSVLSLQVGESEVCAIFLSPYIPVPRPGASFTVALLIGAR